MDIEQLLKNRIKAELELGDAIEELDEEIERRLGGLLAKKGMTLDVNVRGRRIEPVIVVESEEHKKLRRRNNIRKSCKAPTFWVVWDKKPNKFKSLTLCNFDGGELEALEIGETIREAFYGKD